MREVVAEATAAGVEMIEAKKTPAYTKMLVWTPDDILVTSHDWGSASTNLSFPQAEVGVHLQFPSFADTVLSRVAKVYPQSRERRRGQRSRSSLLKRRVVSPLPHHVGGSVARCYLGVERSGMPTSAPGR